RLFLARDRIGEKPLYYYKGSSKLTFASEIKALLADPDIPRELNPRGLANFLTFGHAVAPETIYKHIYKLLPGHYLIAQESGIETAQYWDVGDEPQIPAATILTDDQYAEKILTCFDDSVRRRM